MGATQRKQGFFSGQDVSNGEMVALQSFAELCAAHGIEAASLGDLPIKGLVPAPDGATRVLPVSAGWGIATNAAGDKRIVRLIADGTVNCALDINGNPTAPAAQPRWILVALKWLSLDSNNRTDDQNVTAAYYSDDSSQLVVIAGTEGGGKPAVPTDCVPVVDFLLQVGQTALTAAEMDRSRARPAYGKVGSPAGLAAQLADLAAAGADNCRVVPDEPADLSVVVRAGGINYGDQRFTVAGGTVGPFTAPAGVGQSQVFLIYVDNAGALQTAAGVAATTGTQVAPSHVGRCPLAEITLAHGQLTIQAADIRDVRPFVRAGRNVPGYYLLNPAAGGEAAITLGFTYLLGSHTLEAFKDGTKLIGGGVDYTETDSGTITLTVGMVAGHKLEVYAPAVADANPVVAHASTHAASGSDPIDYSPLAGLVAPGFRAYSTGDTALTIKPFAAIINGVMRSSGADINVAAQISALAASTWYYFYAYYSAGSVLVEVNTTAPDSMLRTKGGDATRTFLFPIRSTSTSKVRAFRRIDQHTVWVVDYANAVAGDPLNGLDATLTGVNAITGKSLVTGFPPYVTYGEIDVVVTSAGLDNTVIAGTNTQVSSKTIYVLVANKVNEARIEVGLGPTTAINITPSANGVTTSIYAYGFEG
jgi:hypothetical protein